MDAAAIRVKIGLRPNGHADHPDWNLLPMAQADPPTDPAKHMLLGGWKYDKTTPQRADGA